MYFPDSSSTVAVTFTSSTSTLSLYRGSCCAPAGCGVFLSGGACAGFCAAIRTAPAHKTQRKTSVPIQTCFCAFMVSHSLAADYRVVFLFLPCRLRPHFIPALGPITQGNCLVAFANDVPVPVGDFHYQTSSA